MECGEFVRVRCGVGEKGGEMGCMNRWAREWGALATEVVKMAPGDKLDFGAGSQFYAERGRVYIMYVEVGVDAVS